MPKQYINFGFNELKKKGRYVPQCEVYIKSLSNASTKPSLLQRRLRTIHSEKKDYDPKYLIRLGESAKKQRIDNTG